MAQAERDNDFDAVRLLAALAVLVGHAWALTGTPGVPVVAGIRIFDLGVDVFFCLSGYLIATSWMRSPRVVPYLLRRVFRIFPALILVVLVAVLVLGPLVTTLSAREYFATPATWGYLVNLALVAVYRLPGVFETNPVHGVVNGSLWTLGPEFLCYLAVLAVGLIAIRMPRPGRVRLLAVAVLGVAIAVAQSIPGVAPAWTDDILRVVVFFAGGAVLAELARAGMLHRALRLPIVLAALVAWLVAGSLAPAGWATPIAWVALPFLVVGLGSRSTPGVRRAARFGDVSYGLYLWGFPVQQTVVLLAPGLPLAVDIPVVAALTGALALGSWWALERRALGAGRRLSGPRSVLSGAARER